MLGFLGNFVGDVSDLGKGLAGLTVGAAKDLFVNPLLETVTLGKAETDYTLDDLAKGLVGVEPKGSLLDVGDWHPMADNAVLGDMWDRYEPLLPGGTPASEAYTRMYEDPLSYVLDAASIASAGAGAAAKGGGLALKGTDAAMTAAKVADDLADAGIAARTARAAGVRSGLDELAATQGLTPGQELARAVLPAKTMRLVGHNLEPSAQMYNPLWRAATAPIRRYGITESLEDFAGRGAQVLEQIAESPADDSLVGTRQLIDDTLAAARDAGLTRIEKPRFARRNVDAMARRMIAEQKGRFINTREKASAAEVAMERRYLEEDPTLADRALLVQQGLDIDLDGYEMASWAARQQMENTRRVATQVPVPAGGVGGVLDDVPFGDEAMPANALPDDPIVERTEAIVGRVREFIQRMETDRDTLTAGEWDVDAEIDGARRVIRGLYDGLARRIQHLDPQADDIDSAVRRTDEKRLMQYEELADGFQTGGLTPLEALDRAYRPVRAKFGLDVRPGALKGERVQFEGGPALSEIDDALHAANEPQPVYVPHIDATRKKTSDFFMSSRPVGANVYAKDPHNEQMRLVLLKRGTWERDPLEVARRRSARAVREQETYQLWDTITRRTGTPIANPNVVPRGYKLVAPDVLFLHYRTRTQLLDAIDDALTEGLDPDTAQATALRKVMEENQALVSELAESGQIKFYAVPDVVLKNLESNARWAPAFGGKNVRLYWDSVQQGYRSVMLYASPRWAVNNALGEVVFGAMEGTKTLDVARIFGQKFKTLVANWTRRRMHLPERDVNPDSLTAQIQRMPGAEDVTHGMVGSPTEQYRPRLGPEAEATGFGQFLTRAQETKVSRGLRTWGDAMRNLTAIIEDSGREAAFLTHAEKALSKSAVTRTARSFWSAKRRVESIMGEGFSEAKGRSAAQMMKRFHGDYGSLNGFERHVVRRWLFPFYSFYKHSTKLLLTFPFEYPERAQALAALTTLQEEMLEEYGPMPDWLESALPLGPPGSDTFLSTRGANPFGGLSTTWISQLGPLQQVAIERALGEDLFTGDEFSDEGTFTPYGSDNRIDKATGQPVEGNVLPSLFEHLLQTVPQYDMAKGLLAGGATYDTTSMLDVMQGQGVIRDDTGAPRYPNDLMDELAGYFGASTIGYDLAGYQERLAEDQEAALREALRQAGGAP